MSTNHPNHPAAASAVLADAEELRPIPDTALDLGLRICVKTGHRWARHGYRGVKLESVLIAGRRLTTPAALRRFIAATQSAPEAAQVAPGRRDARRATPDQHAALEAAQGGATR